MAVIYGVERFDIDLHFSVLHIYPRPLHRVYPSPSKADINTIKSSCQNLREFLMKERMQPEKKPHFLASIRLTVFFSLNKKNNIKLSHPFCTIVPPSLRFYNFGRNKYSKCFRLEENIVAEKNCFTSF